MRAKPGEISLAHNGVLFLDELPEFDPRVLDSLRQPLENGEVSVSRANHRVTYPARFMLVAAMNPCPCGYHGDPHHSCSCSPLDVQRYLARVSGPLLDRIDIHLEVPAVAYRELADRAGGAPSAVMRERVDRARQVQRERFRGRPGIFANAHMAPRDIRAHCRVADEAEALLRTAITRLGLSARATTASSRSPDDRGPGRRRGPSEAWSEAISTAVSTGGSDAAGECGGGGGG
jgi:magnesium chelatase family protein